MANSIKLTFAGDADSLSKASKQSEKALGDVGKAADQSGKQLAESAKQSTDLGTKIGHLGSAVSGASDTFDALGGSLQAVVDLQQAGAERASRLARAELDVEQASNDTRQAQRDLRQAQLDLNQSRIDGRQAALDQQQAEGDARQALLDAAKAQSDYNDAVKEHGKNSLEARQALLDAEQAQRDLNQAQLDGEQAQADANQATEDGNQALQDGDQAALDFKTSMQDLSDAMREAHPPELGRWAQDVQTFAPLVTAVVGVIGLATTAQWLWNAALWASPITWIVGAVLAFAGIMIYLATQTTVFQDTWRVVWDFLKGIGAWFAGPFADFFVGAYHKVTNYFGDLMAYVKSIPTQLKNAFLAVTDFISAPFRAAFNLVSTAWNATIGRLHWTVPGWVPGFGGNSISAPTLPHFHTGGIVSGALGSETLAVLQAGERVTPAGGGHAEEAVTLNAGGDFDEMVLASVRRAVGLRGNDPVRVLRGNRG